MKGQKQYPESYKRFLKTAKKQTGWTEKRIKEAMRSQFGSFCSRDMSKYLAHLATLMDKTWNMETEKKRNPPCPICYAPTVGDLGLYGKYTKTPGWRCLKGGTPHFVEHKVNCIVAIRNQHKDEMDSLPNESAWMDGWMNLYREEDDLDREDNGIDIEGDKEPGCSGLRGDTPERDGVAAHDREDSEIVSRSTPARL